MIFATLQCSISNSHTLGSLSREAESLAAADF